MKVKFSQFSKTSAMLLTIGVTLSGCASGLNSLEKRELKYFQLTDLAVEEKNVAIAGVLGILPGGGSFYTEEYTFGVLNLLLWPASILWDPFSGINGAEQANYAATKIRIDRLKSEELDALEDKLKAGSMQLAQYTLEKNKITKKFEPKL